MASFLLVFKLGLCAYCTVPLTFLHIVTWQTITCRWFYHNPTVRSSFFFVYIFLLVLSALFSTKRRPGWAEDLSVKPREQPPWSTLHRYSSLKFITSRGYRTCQSELQYLSVANHLGNHKSSVPVLGLVCRFTLIFPFIFSIDTLLSSLCSSKVSLIATSMWSALQFPSNAWSNFHTWSPSIY